MGSEINLEIAKQNCYIDVKLVSNDFIFVKQNFFI